MSSGAYCSLRLPTADAEISRSMPSSLNPKIFARKFSSDGRIRWPAPCRARNATRLPPSVPSRYGPDGSPNGVFTAISSRSVKSAMSYRPLPPITPICADAGKGPPRLQASDFRLQAWSPKPGAGSRHYWLHVAFSVTFANIAGGDVGVVLEQNQILTLDRFAQ